VLDLQQLWSTPTRTENRINICRYFYLKPKCLHKREFEGGSECCNRISDQSINPSIDKS